MSGKPKLLFIWCRAINRRHITFNRTQNIQITKTHPDPKWTTDPPNTNPASDSLRIPRWTPLPRSLNERRRRPFVKMKWNVRIEVMTPDRRAARRQHCGFNPHASVCATAPQRKMIPKQDIAIFFYKKSILQYCNDFCLPTKQTTSTPVKNTTL